MGGRRLGHSATRTINDTTRRRCRPIVSLQLRGRCRTQNFKEIVIVVGLLPERFFSLERFGEISRSQSALCLHVTSTVYSVIHGGTVQLPSPAKLATHMCWPTTLSDIYRCGVIVPPRNDLILSFIVIVSVWPRHTFPSLKHSSFMQIHFLGWRK